MVKRSAGDVIVSGPNRYTIQRELGRGGTARTYEAVDGRGAIVVLKELRLEVLSSWKALELLEREASALRRLEHPAIPRYVDAFALDPTGTALVATRQEGSSSAYVLAQSKVDGESVAARVDRCGPFDGTGAETLLRRTCGVLSYLHGLTPPMIHRDITPKNVLVSADGTVHLVDFGAVQDRVRREASLASTNVGTVGYAPHEQWIGMARPATDIYALGMTVIFALTGKDPSRLPYDEKRECVDVDAVLPGISPRLRSVLKRMTEPRVAHRLATGADVLAALDARAARARPVVLAASLGAVLSVGLGLAASVALRTSHASEPSTARRTPTAMPAANPDLAWFARVRPRCNGVEVDTAMREDPPPATGPSRGYAATCYALAGKIDATATQLDRADAAGQGDTAIGILFDQIHEVADKGDDKAAGPVMKLVVDRWPENYMAMYHAGMAEYATGDLGGARRYLTRFVGMYHVDDGFHRTAQRVLASLDRAQDPACDAKATLATDPEGRRIAQRCQTSAATAQPRAQK